MTNANMILVFSLILQSFVGSVYSTRTDSTFDQLKERAYNSFGTVKDFAGHSMETVKDTASDAMGSVKHTIWWSYSPANAPSEAPATAPHHGHHHHHQNHHHHKFHADSPAPISADDSAGSMHEAKQVHKVTIHTSMHDIWNGVLPGNKAYNDVTGDPDKAVKDWGKGFAGAHHHHHKGNGAAPPKASTMQERILRESYKHKAHTPSPTPTNAASPGHQKAHDGSGKKIHTTIHTANHKFDDVTGDATTTFHDWIKHRHGKGAPVPKSSFNYKRGLGESHNVKRHHTPSAAPTTPTYAAGRNHQIGRDIHKPAKAAQSPSPMTSGPKGKIHNTIHTSMKGIEKSILPNTAYHRFNDVTGDTTATFHDWAKEGHGKVAPVPKSSAKHNRGLSESHHGKATPGKHSNSPAAPTIAAGHSHHKHKSHANSPSPVTSGDYTDAILHNTIHTAVNHKFDDVTGDATATFHDWAKDASSPKSSTKHRDVHGHGRGLSESHKRKGIVREHPHTPSAAPTIAAGPEHHGVHKSHDNSQWHVSNGDPVVHDDAQKRIHITIHTAADTARAKFNDVTGDAGFTLRHWAKDGHGTKGSKSHSREAFSPNLAPKTHHGAPVTHERHLRASGPHHTPLHSGGHSHHGHPASAPATTPSPSSNGQHKAHKGTVHMAVNDNYNAAQATYNDITGDDVAAYNDWDSHRSYGSHQ